MKNNCLERSCPPFPGARVKKTVASVAQPAEKPAEKPVERPVAQAAPKPAEKPVERPVAQAAPKPAEKKPDKPVAAERPVAKPADRPVTKSVRKPEVKPMEQTKTTVVVQEALTDAQMEAREAAEQVRVRERKAAAEAQAEEALRRQEEERAASEWKSDFFSLLAGCRFVRFAAWMLILCVGIYLAVNFLSLVRLAADPCPFVRWPALALVAVLAGAIGWALWLARRAFVALPVFPQVVYVEGRDHKRAVEALARGYVTGFPGDPAECAKLDRGKERLSETLAELRRTDVADRAEWFRRFRSLQAQQDRMAAAVVSESAKLVGLKSAACPWRAGDVLIVFFNTTLMVTALARIYNRRISSTAAFRLVLRWIFQLYIVGRMQDFTEAGANAAVDVSVDGASALGGQNWGEFLTASAPVLKTVLGKVSEGAVNAYMVWRLGRRAIEEFRPLKVVSR